jgi:recombination protein RecA
MTDALKKLVNGAVKRSPHIIQDVKQAGILQKIPCDSPQLNYMLSGGITIGRIHRFRGPESSGKSTICNYLCGQLQRKLSSSGLYGVSSEQRMVVYVDWEHSFDMIHAIENGLLCDEDHFIYMTPDSVEDFTDEIIPMIKTNEIAGIIFDSDAAAATRATWTDPSGKASFGGLAKSLGESIRKINATGANYKTTTFWISQERVNMKPMSHLPEVTGGEAPKYYASTVNRVQKMDSIKDGNETAGIQIRIRNYKNKCGIPFRDANINLYYKGGFNPNEEYLQFIVDLGIFKQGGAWFTNEEFGVKLNGRDKVQNWLNDHPEEYNKMKTQVDEMLTKSTDLDKDNQELHEDLDIEKLKEESGNDEISDELL